MRSLVFTISIFLFGSCTGNAIEEGAAVESISVREQVLPDSSEALGLTGRELAQAYCSACHTFPEPTLLDKKTWQHGVLPNMALRLGLNLTGGNPYLNKPQQEVIDLLQAAIYPDKPYIAESEWKKIEDFYLQNAPVELDQPVVPVTDTVLSNFSVIVPAVNQGRRAYTTLVKYLPATQSLWIGDGRNQLYKMDARYQVVDSVHIPSAAVALVQGAGHYKVLAIGSLHPSDVANGKLLQFPVQGKNKTSTLLIEGLRRPVDVVEADLVGDGLPDLIVCNYGNNLGSISWYRNTGRGDYQAFVLKNLPGARKVEVFDFDGDGKLDIVALFAQGTEAIKLFLNKGSGKFEEKTLLQFPPVFGLSYFEITDFNKDGHPDLLLSNGDNADYSTILKPYHGIRIYLNDGKDKFQEAFFYPMHGASKVLARDFDQDGNLDIAAISFFPNFNNSSEPGFVYLQQDSFLSFKAKTFAQANKGHWLTMDAGDFDQDDDTDLVLGSFTYTPVPPGQQALWLKEGPGVIVLQNNRMDSKASASK